MINEPPYTDPNVPVLLVVDDEQSILRAFNWVFRNEELLLLTAVNATEGIEIVREHQPNVVILDINLPDLSGLEAYQRIREIDPKIPVIFITGRGTTDTAIEATKLGALDYLFKPLDLHRLREVVRSAIDVSQRMRVPAIMASSDTTSDPNGSTQPNSADLLIGRSRAMNDVYRLVGQVAPLDDPVLILGESGTGKELIARAIWHHGSRSEAPFLAINCAAIHENLIESELFGHEQGAFTGAARQRIGKFEQYSGGTLFLDEIGDMAAGAQAKMLRVLQDQTFERVGGNQTIRSDVRIIAATNRSQEDLVQNHDFRSDLYYRLSVFTVKLPPLRERGSDLALLADHFLQRFSADFGKRIEGIAPEALRLLERYPWPGNIRQLQSVLKQAILKAVGPTIDPDCLPTNLRGTDGPSPQAHANASATLADWDQKISDSLTEDHGDLYREMMAPVERHLIMRVLRHTGGNQQQAAQFLGITRGTLRTKVRALDIGLDELKWSNFNQE